MKIHKTFTTPTSDVCVIYTSGMTENGLAELLVQDVPRNKAGVICSMLERQIDQLRTKETYLYSGKRLVVEGENYYFRVIEVLHDEHKINLLTHTMLEWNTKHADKDDSALQTYVTLFIIAPWFSSASSSFSENEDGPLEWGGLPAAPDGRTERRNKILWTAVSRDANGWSSSRWSSESHSRIIDDRDDDRLDERDVLYLVRHAKHFCRCLEVSSLRKFLDSMPPRFEMEALAMMQARLLTAAASPHQHHHHHHQYHDGGGQSRVLRPPRPSPPPHRLGTTNLRPVIVTANPIWDDDDDSPPHQTPPSLLVRTTVLPRLPVSRGGGGHCRRFVEGGGGSHGQPSTGVRVSVVSNGGGYDHYHSTTSSLSPHFSSISTSSFMGFEYNGEV